MVALSWARDSSANASTTARREANANDLDADGSHLAPGRALLSRAPFPYNAPSSVDEAIVLVDFRRLRR